jgi:hypothetical protein
MTIDLERLAFDIDYWNQVAPIGASHLINNVYHRWNGGIKFRTTEKDLPWVQSSNSFTLVEYYANKSCTVIAKPIKPAAPEFDGINLPPVGADQTVFVPFRALSLRASASTESTWSVVAHHSGMAVVVINECGHGKLTVAILSEKECRPVVSQAERERKELATFLEDYHLEMGSYWCPEKEADYILSSYDVAKKATGEL